MNVIKGDRDYISLSPIFTSGKDFGMFKSKVTGKEYDLKDVVFIRNLAQFEAYCANGGDSYLVDIFYDKTKEKNKMVFAFLKCDETRELYKKWNERILEF